MGEGNWTAFEAANGNWISMKTFPGNRNCGDKERHIRGKVGIFHKGI